MQWKRAALVNDQNNIFKRVFTSRALPVRCLELVKIAHQLFCNIQSKELTKNTSLRISNSIPFIFSDLANSHSCKKSDFNGIKNDIKIIIFYSLKKSNAILFFDNERVYEIKIHLILIRIFITSNVLIIICFLVK